MPNKEKLEKIKQLATKWTTANEFFDKLIANDWVELPPVAKKFVNQIGEQLLEIIEERENNKTKKAKIT